MRWKAQGSFQPAIRLVLITLFLLGLAGCASRPVMMHVYVDGEIRTTKYMIQNHEEQDLLDSLFIKRTAMVDGQTITYFVDRKDPGKIYTMRQDKTCVTPDDACLDKRYFTSPEESLRQQLREIEALRPPESTPSTTSPPPLPVSPSLLPDARITVPTVPPVALPQN